jgi:histone H3/H4
MEPAGKMPKAEVEEVEAMDVEEMSEDDADCLVFPVGRVKKIAAMATNHTLKADTIRLITKAAEVFLEDLAAKAIGITVGKKKKTVTNNDILEVADRHSNLLFVRESRLVPASARESKSQRESLASQTTSQPTPFQVDPTSFQVDPTPPPINLV